MINRIEFIGDNYQKFLKITISSLIIVFNKLYLALNAINKNWSYQWLEFTSFSINRLLYSYTVNKKDLKNVLQE